jgi:hypothetical protein
MADEVTPQAQGLLFPPQTRRDGRSPILGLVPSPDSGRQFNFDSIDAAVGALDTALTLVVGGTIPDGTITTAKLAPGAAAPGVVSITNTSGLGPIPVTDTLISEWTVQGMAGRPVFTIIETSLTVLNTTGGINNPSDTVLTLRQGGSGVTGAVVQETAPFVVAIAQNQQTAIFPAVAYVWTPSVDGPVRWSLTGRNPGAAKNTVTVRSISGNALTLA